MKKSSSLHATEGLSRKTANSAEIAASDQRRSKVAPKATIRESRGIAPSGVRKPKVARASKFGSKPKSRLDQYGPKRTTSLQDSNTISTKLKSMERKTTLIMTPKKTEFANQTSRSKQKTISKDLSDKAPGQGSSATAAFSHQNEGLEPVLPPSTDANLPTSLEFHLRTAKKPSKRDQLTPVSLETSLQVRPTPIAKTKQIKSHFTPLMVRNDVIDMFSPEEFLVSPVERTDERMSTEQRLHAAIVIQKHVRGCLSKRRLVKARTCTILIQTVVRGFLARRVKKSIMINCAAKRIRSSVLRFLTRIHVAKLKQRVSAAVKIQSYWKMRHQKRKFLLLKIAAVSIQRVLRGRNGRLLAKRQRLLKVNNAAVCIQSTWKAVSSSRKYTIQCQAALLMQRVSRGRKGRFLAKRQRLLKVNKRSCLYSELLESRVFLSKVHHPVPSCSNNPECMSGLLCTPTGSPGVPTSASNGVVCSMYSNILAHSNTSTKIRNYAEGHYLGSGPL